MSRHRITVRWMDTYDDFTAIVDVDKGGYYLDKPGVYEFQCQRGAPIITVPLSSSVRFVITEDLKEDQ